MKSEWVVWRCGGRVLRAMDTENYCIGGIGTGEEEGETSNMWFDGETEIGVRKAMIIVRNGTNCSGGVNGLVK